MCKGLWDWSEMNDLTIEWENWNPLSHPKASKGQWWKFELPDTIATSKAKWWNFEPLAELLVWYPGKIIAGLWDYGG